MAGGKQASRELRAVVSVLCIISGRHAHSVYSLDRAGIGYSGGLRCLQYLSAHQTPRLPIYRNYFFCSVAWHLSMALLPGSCAALLLGRQRESLRLTSADSARI